MSTTANKSLVLACVTQCTATMHLFLLHKDKLQLLLPATKLHKRKRYSLQTS